MNSFVFVLVLTGTMEFTGPENDIDVFQSFEQCQQASAKANQTMLSTGQVATCFPRLVNKENMAFAHEMLEKMKRAESEMLEKMKRAESVENTRRQ